MSFDLFAQHGKTMSICFLLFFYFQPNPRPQYQEPIVPSPPHKDYLPDVTGTENESEYVEEEDDGAPETEDYEEEYVENENGNWFQPPLAVQGGTGRRLVVDLGGTGNVIFYQQTINIPLAGVLFFCCAIAVILLCVVFTWPSLLFHITAFVNGNEFALLFLSAHVDADVFPL